MRSIERSTSHIVEALRLSIEASDLIGTNLEGGRKFAEYAISFATKAFQEVEEESFPIRQCINRQRKEIIEHLQNLFGKLNQNQSNF